MAPLPLSNAKGYIIAIEGNASTISEQLRLLPFSRNVLCLPPIPVPPPTCLPPASSSEGNTPGILAAAKEQVLALHQTHIERLEQAKEFIKAVDCSYEGNGAAERKMVFMNGGVVASKLACLQKIQELVPGGNPIEAERIFEEILAGGLKGLASTIKAQEKIEFEHTGVQTDWNYQDKATSIEMPVLKEQERGPRSGDSDTKSEVSVDKEGAKRSESSGSRISRDQRSGHDSHTPRPSTPSTPGRPDAGVECGKASIAVRIRPGNNLHGSKDPPPPSPPDIRDTQFPLPLKQLSKTSDGSRKETPREILSQGLSDPEDTEIPPAKSQFTTPIVTPNQGNLDTEEDYRHVKCFRDSAYSSGMSPIHTPPSSATIESKPSADISEPQFKPSHQDSFSINSIGSTHSASTASTRSPSPTPSSMADVSSVTIANSPRYLHPNRLSYSGNTVRDDDFSTVRPLSGDYGIEEMEEAIAEAAHHDGIADPLFPGEDVNLVIYLEEKNLKDVLLEKLMKDFSVDYLSRTPGAPMPSPSTTTDRRHSCCTEVLSSSLQNTNISENEQRALHKQHRPDHATSRPPKAASVVLSTNAIVIRSPLPTISVFPSKSAAKIQNELRSILCTHFPTNSYQVPGDVEENWHWLLMGEADHLFKPIFSGPADMGSEILFPGVDLIVAIGLDMFNGKKFLLDDERQRGQELARAFAQKVEELGRKRTHSSRGGRINLKYLLSSTLPYLTHQHPSHSLQDVAQGLHLLPKLEQYALYHPLQRLLIIEFDLSTGSDAIMTLHRQLAGTSTVMKVACIADSTTQIFPKTASLGNRIYVRTSIGHTTASYSSLPSPLNTSAPPLPKPKPHSARQTLISKADVLLPPLSNVTGAAFADGVKNVEIALRERERLTGYYEEPDAEPVVTVVPPVTEKRYDVKAEEKNKKEKREKKGREKEIRVDRINNSYYMDDDEDDDEELARTAMVKKGVERGSKALKWLGLE